MSYELEYFTEFLENPSAPELAEFYWMVKAWCIYLRDHKDDFNYLEDDEWKEIRERLLAEMHIREDLKDEIEIEWEEILEDGDLIHELGDDEVIKFMKRKLNFMKVHREFYEFKDDDIADLEVILKDFENSVREQNICQEKVRITELALEKSLAQLDEKMLKAYKHTGKYPFVHWYRGKKYHKGN